MDAPDEPFPGFASPPGRPRRRVPARGAGGVAPSVLRPTGRGQRPGRGASPLLRLAVGRRPRGSLSGLSLDAQVNSWWGVEPLAFRRCPWRLEPESNRRTRGFSPLLYPAELSIQVSNDAAVAGTRQGDSQPPRARPASRTGSAGDDRHRRTRRVLLLASRTRRARLAGGGGGTRTHIVPGKSRALCPLSYASPSFWGDRRDSNPNPRVHGAVLSPVELRPPRFWSAQRASNPRPSRWQRDALPSELCALEAGVHGGIRTRVPGLRARHPGPLAGCGRTPAGRKKVGFQGDPALG